MTNDESNNLRLYANEIMRRLYEAGQLDQLRILELYATNCIQTAKEKTGQTPSF